MDDGKLRENTTLDPTLERIGPRLQSLRARRGATLAEVSAATGISTSTLSRLETGQRRASLELLLPLAREYRVSLDALVGAPETGDPRVRLRPSRVNGRTVVALTRQPGERHAWKIVVPRSSQPPRLTSHDGSSWMYVLSGRIRLIVGDRDVVLASGEVAEFDTRTPHWFGATGDEDAEILTIFGATAGLGHHHEELATRHLAEALGDAMLD
ncbi:MAG: XRE family transcriptional regulator [Candidatus Microbacterium colombiense]|nr:MAG: XRE family transcriptional regulator [Microbacterium sp.]